MQDGALILIVRAYVNASIALVYIVWTQQKEINLPQPDVILVPMIRTKVLTIMTL